MALLLFVTKANLPVGSTATLLAPFPVAAVPTEVNAPVPPWKVGGGRRLLAVTAPYVIDDPETGFPIMCCEALNCP